MKSEISKHKIHFPEKSYKETVKPQSHLKSPSTENIQYIGMPAMEFKQRYKSHEKYLRHERYVNDTKLSKHTQKNANFLLRKKLSIQNFFS